MIYSHLDGGFELSADKVTPRNEYIRRDIVLQWRAGRKVWGRFEIKEKAVHVGPFPYVCLEDAFENYFYVLIPDDPRAKVGRFRARLSSKWLLNSGLSAVEDFDDLKDELGRMFDCFAVPREFLKVARLDIAIDDIFFKVSEVIRAERAGLICSHFKTVSTVVSDGGDSITFGRGSSAWQVCVYDKTSQEGDLAKIATIFEKVTSDIPDHVLEQCKKIPHVTRFEVRFKREFLTSIGMGFLEQVDLRALLSFVRDNFRILEKKSTNKNLEKVDPRYERLFLNSERVQYSRAKQRRSVEITKRALKCAVTIISKTLVRSSSSESSWSVISDQIWHKVRNLSGSSLTRIATPQPQALF